MIGNKLNVTEVSVIIGASVQTINSWYKFKKENPENELAQKLPEFTRDGSKHTRYWNKDDIWKFMDFKSNITIGRYGVMGSVTQKYVHKDKKKRKK